MKFQYFATLVFLVLLVFGCSKKAKTYEVIKTDDKTVYLNKNLPANPDLRIGVKKVFEIYQYDSTLIRNEYDPKYFFSICADNNNIYLSTYDSKGLIYQYDEGGSFIKSFSTMGKGPGESTGYDKLIIMHDTLYAVASRGCLVNKFTSNGSFIDATILDKLYLDIIKLNTNHFLGFAWDEVVIDEFKSEVKIEVNILDSKFKTVETIIRKQIIHEGIEGVRSKLYPYICANDKEIFISWISESEYEISVYDINTGDYKYEIKNSYRIKDYSDVEIDWLSSYNKVDMRKKFDKLKKRAINTIYCDDYGRLWVLATKDRKIEKHNILYADIYSGGIFQNTLEIPEIEYHDFSGAFSVYKMVFANRKIYFHNSEYFDEEKGKVIKVFEY